MTTTVNPEQEVLPSRCGDVFSSIHTRQVAKPSIPIPPYPHAEPTFPLHAPGTCPSSRVTAADHPRRDGHNKPLDAGISYQLPLRVPSRPYSPLSPFLRPLVFFPEPHAEKTSSFSSRGPSPRGSPATGAAERTCRIGSVAGLRRRAVCPRVDLPWNCGGGDALRGGLDLLLGCGSGTGRAVCDLPLRAAWVESEESDYLWRLASSSLPFPAMETLVAISQQRNHHPAGLSKSSGLHFSSPPSTRGFRGMNCRESFHSGTCGGLLPSPPPPPARTYSSPEPKTPKQQQQPRNSGKRSRPISISPSSSPPSHAELWAGPAFSNSPPPSSLPIPKFSLRQKRSISLELPPVERSDDVELRPHAKSAPSSPVGGLGFDFFHDNETAIATENLRRILHLDIADH